MKTLLSLSLATFVTLALASPGICQEKPKATDTKKTKTHDMVDHVMMKKGKMMVVKGGKWRRNNYSVKSAVRRGVDGRGSC